MNNSQEVKAPRGPLALLVHPINHRSTTVRTNEVTHILHYFENRPNAPRLSRTYKRRRAKTDEDPEGDQPSTNNLDGSILYHPSQGEFTLFFFCEMNCRNSQRITMILTNFISTANKGDDENKIIQLVCVPNDENINLSRTASSSADILSHLSSQIDYWLLGYDHVNRLAIIRYVFVTRPTFLTYAAIYDIGCRAEDCCIIFLVTS